MRLLALDSSCIAPQNYAQHRIACKFIRTIYTRHAAASPTSVAALGGSGPGAGARDTTNDQESPSPSSSTSYVVVTPIYLHSHAHHPHHRLLVSRQNKFAETVERTKAAALRLLSRRSHSRKELTTKLEERKYPVEAITVALDRLGAVGLQSDEEFAEAFARSKWRQTKWSPSKIKMVRVYLFIFYNSC